MRWLKAERDKELDEYIKEVRNVFKEEKPSLLKDLKKFYPGIVDIKLGGSFAKGTPTYESDIDYVIVYEGDRDLYELANEIRPLETKNGLVDIVIEKIDNENKSTKEDKNA